MERSLRFRIFFNFNKSNDKLYCCYDPTDNDIEQKIKKHNLKVFLENKEDSKFYDEIYIFGPNEDSISSEFFKEEKQILDVNKFYAILNCIKIIFPNFQDDLHIVLLQIIIKNIDIFKDSEKVFNKDINNAIFNIILNDFDDSFLYSLFIYQLYFSKFIELKHQENFRTSQSESNIKSGANSSKSDTIKSKSTTQLCKKLELDENVKAQLNEFKEKMKLPKISFPIIYTKPRFQEPLHDIYNIFHDIYNSIIQYQIYKLDQFYIFSWIFFPCIYYDFSDLVKNKINYDSIEFKESEFAVSNILMMRVYISLRDIENDIGNIESFFGSFFIISDLNEFPFYKMENNDDNKLKPFSFPDVKNESILIDSFDLNFRNFPNLGYIIPSNDVIENSKCKHNLDWEGFTNNETIFNKYSTGMVDEIDPFILHSNLFKHISAFLCSDQQNNNFSYYGNLLELAAKLTFDFFNIGIQEDNLKSIDELINDPILNGLYGIIKKKFFQNVNPDLNSNEENSIFYKKLNNIFLDQLVDELVDEGKKILGIQTSECDYLSFRIRYSVEIAYKFSAMLEIKNNSNIFSDENKEDNDSLENLLKLMVEDQNENAIDNSLIRDSESAIDNSLIRDNENVINQLIELINFKGFYYHFFIIKTIFNIEQEKNYHNAYKPMLSSVYKILLNLDEHYILILDTFLMANKLTQAVALFKSKIIPLM